MKRSFLWIISIMVILGLLLAACGSSEEPAEDTMTDTGEATSEEAPADEGPKEVTLTIGFTASQTGSLEVSSKRQLNGFNLWMEQVNAAGGVTLSDGTVIKFQSVFYDDESNKERVQELYTRLITEDNADLLIIPYSSGLTAAAAVIAEQYGKVMITTGAADDDAYKQGYTQIFQLYTPGSGYLLSSVDMINYFEPGAKIALVYENDKFATTVIDGVRPYAEANGFEIVMEEGYASDTTDFGPIINKIVESGAVAVLGGGHFQDGSTFARQLYERNTDVKFVGIIVAAPDTKFAELGDAALGVTGPSQWEGKATHTEEEANNLGKEWFGISGADFIAAYQAATGEEPTYHAAGGYAAGAVLQKAIIDADSTDPAAIKQALDAMDIFTFYGGIKFDTSAEAHGLQIGHSMVVTQWQNDGGTLVRHVVWPLDVGTAEPIYPIP